MALKKIIFTNFSISKFYVTNYRSFNNLGHLERINENYEFAVNYYKKSISINPNYIHAHYNLMEILEKMHEHDRLKLSINEAKNIFGVHPIVLMFQSLIQSFFTKSIG